VSTAERTGRRLTPGQTTWLSTVFAVVIGGLLWLSVAGDQWQSARTLFWGDLALGVASLAAMQCRRRWPLAVTVLTVAAAAVSVSAIGPWIVCQVSLSARRRWREILPTAALSVLAGQASLAVQPNRTMSWSVNLVFCVLAAGQIDLALDAHMEPYDIAPLIPIIEGAGGIVTTWERGDAAPGGNVIAASSQAVYEEALAVIHAS